MLHIIKIFCCNTCSCRFFFSGENVRERETEYSRQELPSHNVRVIAGQKRFVKMIICLLQFELSLVSKLSKNDYTQFQRLLTIFAIAPLTGNFICFFAKPSEFFIISFNHLGKSQRRRLFQFGCNNFHKHPGKPASGYIS